jgi:hypothetical protein
MVRTGTSPTDLLRDHRLLDVDRPCLVTLEILLPLKLLPTLEVEREVVQV